MLTLGQLEAVLIPTGVGHGFFSLLPSTHFYSTSRAWSIDDEFGCRYAGVALSVVFHSLTVVALNEDFGTFSYTVVLATGVLFAKLPIVRDVQFRFPSFVRMSPFGAIRFCQSTAGPVKVDLQNGLLKGVLALEFLYLVTMPGQLAFLGLAAASGRLGVPLTTNTSQRTCAQHHLEEKK